MLKERVQNNVCSSVFLLPGCAIIALLLWWFPQCEFTPANLGGLALCALITYVILETNNVNALIRVRSRSVSSLWLLMVGCIGFLHPFQMATLSSLFLTISYYLLFRTYQATQPVVDVFHTFVMVGLSCLFLPQATWLAPIFLWHLIVFMRVFSFRCMWSAVLGFLLPFWFALNICYMTDRMLVVVDWLSGVTAFVPISLENYTQLDVTMIAVWGVIGILTLWCGIQYLMHSFADKIRTRMLFYIYIIQAFIILLFVVLQPQHAGNMLMPMTVSCIPFIAHYFTLSKSWFCSFIFVLSLLTFVALAILTLAQEYLPENILSLLNNKL